MKQIKHRLLRELAARRPAMRKKVIGIGLPKTGTTTLGYCLSIMGYKHKTFDPGLTVKVKRGDIASALAEARCYEALEDWPWFLIYPELFNAFPDAKFILTVRASADAYVGSLRRFRARKGTFDDSFAEPSWWREVTGSPPDHWDEDALVSAYYDHIAKVQAFFRYHPERLITLCWESGDDWERLCQFLDKPIPDLDFPHLNRTF